MKPQSTQKWFKAWANEYDKTLGSIDRHHQLLDRAVAVSGVCDGAHVLDIGCGTGLLSLKFLNAAACTITGIDNSKEMLRIWKDKIKKLKLSDRATCSYADAAKIPFKKNTFDIVASTVTLHHVKNKQPVINKIHTLLKSGGQFIIGDLDVDTSGKLTDTKRLRHIMDYLKEELTLALQDGGIRAFSRMYDNGKKHILNDGEYCINFRQWKKLCSNAGFKNISIQSIPSFKWLKVLRCEKR